MPFDYSVKDRKLLASEAEAHVLREAFALLLGHRQFAVVARELDGPGLLPCTSEDGRKAGLL